MGVYSALNYVATSPEDHGSIEIGMQSTEHGWLTVKGVQSHRGNPNGFNFLITTKFVDAITYGGLACDQADPRKIKRTNRRVGGKVQFDPNFEDTMMQNVIDTMPARAQVIVQNLFAIKVGDINSIDDSLLDPFYKNRRWHTRHKMLSQNVKKKYRAFLLSENEIMIEEFDISTCRKKYERKSILKNLKRNLKRDLEDTSNVDIAHLEEMLDSADSIQSSNESSYYTSNTE